MKDSGIEWIGKIPENWELVKIAGLYSLRNTKVSDKDFPPLSVTMKGVVPQLETAAKTNDHGNRKLVKKGDFVINSRSDRRGSCGVSEFDGSVSLINTVLKPNRIMVNQYYNWLFHTFSFSDEFYKWGHGIVDDLWTTTWQDMKKMVVPFPTIEKQKSIADFLDSKCNEIDNLCTDIKKEIKILEEYKKAVITETVTKGLDSDVEMKDSGIEWIGMIPKHWNVEKGKYNFVQKSDRGNTKSLILLSPTQNYGVIPQELYEQLSGFSAVKLNEETDLNFFKTVHKGAFVISLRSFQGGFEYSEYEGVVSPAYQVFYPSISVCDYYYKYLFKTQSFIDKMNSYTMSLRDGKNIAFADFGRTYIPIPPVDEQQEIANYLDEKCTEIDDVITDKKEQIQILAEYKKNLIYEYVTGKKEIPIEDKLDPNAILLGIIATKLGKYQTGKIQIQKILYLACEHLGLNTKAQYYRYNHGPYDVNLDCYIEALTNNQWFEEEKGKSLLLILGEKNEDFLNKNKEQIEKCGNKIVDLLNLLFKMNSLKRSRLERITTLYAVWNDFLLEGIEPTDDQIIKEVMTNWTDNKSNTQYSTWKASLNKMKNNSLIPKGVGLHTLKKA